MMIPQVMDFIASDASQDRYGEVINLDGWKLDSFRRNPVIPDCHDYSSVSRILGRAQSIEITEGKLVNRVEFALDNPLGALAYKLAKGGFLKAQSVGFIPLEWVNGNGRDEPYRTYTQCELLEVSMVVVPANPNACNGIGLALKSGAIERRDINAVVEFLKQFCSDPADPASQASTTAPEVNEVHLLRIARSFSDVLKGH